MENEVTFTPGIDDHIAGQRLWLVSYLRRPITMWLFIMGAILSVGAICIASYQVAFDQASLEYAFGDNAIPIIFPLLLIGLQGIAWARVPGSVRRMAQQQPSLLSETTWRWDTERLVASSEAGSSIVRFSDVHRWLSGHASIVLMPQERSLLILPRRALTLGQMENLENLLTQFAGGKRWPKASK